MQKLTTIILASLTLTLSACGGMSRPASNMPKTQMEAGAPDEYYDLSTPEGKRAEIARQFEEIGQWRRQTGYSAEPEQLDIESAPTSVDHTRLGQPPSHAGRSLTCIDICKIQDSICDNAESICRLADELEEDEWATDKCESSKASCEDASDNCTQCTPPSPKKDSDSRTKIPPTL